MHAAVPVSAVIDAIRQAFRPDAFFPTGADSAHTHPSSPREDGMHAASSLSGIGMHAGGGLKSDLASTSTISQPSQLVIALMGSLSVAPASGTKAIGEHLSITPADYTAILAFVSDCAADDALLATFLVEIYKIACRPEHAVRFRAISMAHGGPVPFLPLLSRVDPSLRCAALMLIACLTPSAEGMLGGTFVRPEEHAAVWRAVSGHIQGTFPTFFLCPPLALPVRCGILHHPPLCSFSPVNSILCLNSYCMMHRECLSWPLSQSKAR